MIVGAPRGDNGGYDAGEAYVIFGKAGAARAGIGVSAGPDCIRRVRHPGRGCGLIAAGCERFRGW